MSIKFRLVVPTDTKPLIFTTQSGGTFLYKVTGTVTLNGMRNSTQKSLYLTFIGKVRPHVT